MGRYRVHYIEGSGENLRIRKEQTVEAPSFQDALERFIALACRRGLRAEPGLCPTSRRQPLPYGGVGSFSCWGELILGKEGFNAVCGVPPFFPIPRIS